MVKFVSIIFVIGLSFILNNPIFAAEILQVRDSNTLIIGDQNRNYTVKIACLETEDSKDKIIKSYLEEILPRHSKVNLKPKGSRDGILISRVIKLDTGDDITTSIVKKGYANSNC